MNTFINSIKEQVARTQNYMKARQSTADSCTDLFFKIGASRGKNIIPQFTAAYAEDQDIALRILQWARDARQGAGERELFRQVLRNLEKTDRPAALRLMSKIPELGRWDDLLVFTDPMLQEAANALIFNALKEGNGLCAKWMPRKGPEAIRLRQAFHWSPKFYRKRLVELTNVVEQQMCANDWDHIDYEKVPSLAASRYKKAFNRHSVTFSDYVEKLVKGEAKVNAGAVYPYDILKGLSRGVHSFSSAELNHIRAQWEALPNFIGDAKILPMVDVSGSMTWHPLGGNTNLYPIDVAVSLGIYMADKNTGPFKDAYLTFSGYTELVHHRGDVVSKMQQLTRQNWGGSTDIIRAFKTILEVATRNNVPQEDMPDTLCIFSDMQFDGCARFDDSAMESIRRQYRNAGYNVPSIIFWNIEAHENVPVRFNEQGVALVSGFSPSIAKTVLSADMEEFTPRNIMLKAVMVDRYAL
jgi:hypothetical protein